MSDWVKCQETDSPTMTGRITYDAGVYITNYQTTALQVSVGGIGFGLSAGAMGQAPISWGDMHKPDGSLWGPILWEPSGVYYPQTQVWRAYKIMLSGGSLGPGMGTCVIEGGMTSANKAPWDYGSSGGIWYYAFVPEAPSPTNWPGFGTCLLDATIEASGGYQLWRKETETPPSGEQTKYWTQCHMFDGWTPILDKWWEGSLSSSLGGGSFRYKFTSTPPGWTSTPQPLLGVGIAFNNHTQPEFTDLGYYAGLWQSVEYVAVGGQNLTRPAFDIDEGGYWHMRCDGSRYTQTYETPSPAQRRSIFDYSDARYLPATVNLSLDPADIGGMVESGLRSDVKIRVPHPGHADIVDTVGALNGNSFTFAASYDLQIDTDFVWGKDNDEIGEVTSTNSETGAIRTFTSTPWKIDAQAPTIKTTDNPYFTGPLTLRHWDFLDLRTGQRNAVGGSPAEVLLSEGKYASSYGIGWDLSRWSIPDHATKDLDGTNLRFTATSTANLSSTRTLFSYYRDRQQRVSDHAPAGTLMPPSCYRITRANHYWPTEPMYTTNPGLGPDATTGSMTRPEDFYDWTAFRYFALGQAAKTYPITLNITITYYTVTVSDSHLTGSTRYADYEATFDGPYEITRSITVTEAGWVDVDMFQLYPKPRFVTSVQVDFGTVVSGDWVEIVGMGPCVDSGAYLNKQIGEPASPHTVVKIFPRWDGTELLGSARIDDTCGAECMDFFSIHLEKGIPYIEWLYGAESGADLSGALSLSGFYTLWGEGWTATWDIDAWHNAVGYYDGYAWHYLSAGRPWDQRWEGGKDTSYIIPYCCIGVRTWNLASGLTYNIHGRQIMHGRLDGILANGDDPIRNSEAPDVATVDSKLPGTDWIDAAPHASDGHGSWWSNPDPEMHISGGTLITDPAIHEDNWQYRIKSPGGTTLYGSVGLGEWVWEGLLAGTPERGWVYLRKAKNGGWVWEAYAASGGNLYARAWISHEQPEALTPVLVASGHFKSPGIIPHANGTVLVSAYDTDAKRTRWWESSDGGDTWGEKT